MERMEPSRMSGNGAGASEMDLAKFYVTQTVDTLDTQLVQYIQYLVVFPKRVVYQHQHQQHQQHQPQPQPPPPSPPPQHQ